MLVTQVEVVESLLTKESVTVIGLLLSVCALLIWHISKLEKKNKDLLDRYISEKEKDKELLIDLVTKNIVANQQTTQTINTIKDVYSKR